MREKTVSVTSPRIVVIVSHLNCADGRSELAAAVSEVSEKLIDRARIEIVDCVFTEIAGLAEERERTDRVDVFVCTGATGAFLRHRSNKPVVFIQTGVGDVLCALDRLSQPLMRTAVLRYREPIAELAMIGRLFQSEIRQFTYETLEQAEQQIALLGREGFEAIVGSSMVVQLARRHRMVGSLAAAPKTIAAALDDAVTTALAIRGEQERKIWLNATLRHLNHGVLATDAEGAIQAVNPAFAELLGRSAASLVGRDISQVAPQLDVVRQLKDARDEGSQVIETGRGRFLVAYHHMRESGSLVGIVLVSQPARAVQGADRQLRISSRRSEYRARYRFEQIIGQSHCLRAQIELAKAYARTDSTVLIRGESGTGKEVFAQAIHNSGGRARSAFVAINCASLPESLLESELFGYEEGAFTGARKGGKPGLFEQAHTGTIFLDEIGDMPPSLQTRLLRVLQEREVVRLGGTQPTPVNVRVLAATHRDLAERIAQGLFRQDLYYRLNILQIRVPPLRERPDDIEELSKRLLRNYAAHGAADLDVDTVVEGLLPLLLRHRWPGNIRELENVLERAALIFGNDHFTRIDGEALEEFLFDDVQHVSGIEDEGSGRPHGPIATGTLDRAIEECGGNYTHAARMLGVSRTTIWRQRKNARRRDIRDEV